MVGACSVVTKDIPPMCIAVGNPLDITKYKIRCIRRIVLFIHNSSGSCLGKKATVLLFIILIKSSKFPSLIANIRLTFKRAKRFIFSTRKREKACMAMKISLY